MPVTIKMPALSPTMTEGKIASWLKKEGDEVRAGDVIAEIETDKATMEVEAVDEGTLGKILSPEGTEHVAVNAPIAVLLEEGEGKDALVAAVKAAESAARAAAKEAAPPREEAPEEKAVAPVAEAAKPAAKAPARAEAPGPAPPAPKLVAPPPAPAPGGRVFASPLARRVAKDAGIELALLSGSGPHGRIVKADVEAAIAGGGARAAAGGILAGLGQRFAPARTRVEPLSTVRKIIAERLAESKRTVPHFYATIDCEIDAMLAIRKEINETDESLNITVNDFVVRAAALALREVPEANASWSDDGIIHYAAADVAVAVATEAGGLITPIVHAADRKGVAAISVEMKDLAARARIGRLMPEEYQGGSFTVSNMGMYGVREFAAIINPPQACILAVGAGEERVVVHDGEIGTATVMTVTLSCDHRAVDGAVGVRWLAAFKQLIEHPVLLIL